MKNLLNQKFGEMNVKKENKKKVLERMLKRLNMVYLDLLLIHWPFVDYISGWKEIKNVLKKIK